MLDVTTFGKSLPAGTYAAGDVVQLVNIDGPANVRSGRGPAILKRITSAMLINASGSTTWWKVHVKNSDWIDDAASLTAFLADATILDKQSGCIQDGQNCPLTPNSSWNVWAECIIGGTTTVGNSLMCTIDVDYPDVSSIVDPAQLTGFPTTIEDNITTDLQAANIETAKWTSHSVDTFKAGYEYAMVKPEIMTSGAAAVGLIKISDAAGMQGLNRVFPISSNVENVRNFIAYASKLRKGPMTISYMLFSQTGSAVTGANANLMIDYVKRRVA